MSILRSLLACAAVASLSAIGLPALAQSPVEVQQRVEGEPLKVGERSVELTRLRPFYRERGYRLAWSGANEARGEQLLVELQAAAVAEGLSPEAYRVPATGSDLDHDLLVSDALMRFGTDLAIGRVQPQRMYGGMGPETRPAFDGQAFLRALAAGKPFAEVAQAVAPSYAGYVRLVQALAHYRTIARAGGWPTIPDGPSIKPGTEDERIAVVRRRLVASGDLDPQYAKGHHKLDGPVSGALKRFQARHGLDQDGAVGKQTLAALNVPVESRIGQIVANLERWRWMPRRLEDSHVAVNIAAAQLELVENGTVTLAMRVVVGDTKHPTPTFTTTMNALTLNPAWQVPPSIATKEILPKLRRDPNYLASQNLRITAFPEDSPEAAGSGMDWTASRKFPYRLRQPPGPDNALGQLKFNLKDSDDIYLHDTPNHKAFGRSYRALSHGCVRVERPIELGERLLGSEWEGKLQAALAKDKTTRALKLEHRVAVYLLYWTAWADPDGSVHFRDDLYGHDKRLQGALDHARATAARVAQDQPHGAL
ncbi:MAG: L,D-transpeptidase family protein [Actinomycetota bacterium]